MYLYVLQFSPILYNCSQQINDQFLNLKYNFVLIVAKICTNSTSYFLIKCKCACDGHFHQCICESSFFLLLQIQFFRSAGNVIQQIKKCGLTDKQKLCTYALVLINFGIGTATSLQMVYGPVYICIIFKDVSQRLLEIFYK